MHTLIRVCFGNGDSSGPIMNNQLAINNWLGDEFP